MAGTLAWFGYQPSPFIPSALPSKALLHILFHISATMTLLQRSLLSVGLDKVISYKRMELTCYWISICAFHHEAGFLGLRTNPSHIPSCLVQKEELCKQLSE